jgi:hypothetical protein
MTDEEIRTRGLRALRDGLGQAGMIRFLQQFETGTGDWARKRRAWVDSTILADIKRKAATKQRGKGQ